jgi:hypothetical protein
MDDKLLDAVLPLLVAQRKKGREATLDECLAQARHHGGRVDLVILLVRHELHLRKHDRTGLFSNFVVDVLTSHSGRIYHDDHEALEALHLVAEAPGQAVTVQVIER